MKHYRIKKVAKPGGATISSKDILAKVARARTRLQRRKRNAN